MTKKSSTPAEKCKPEPENEQPDTFCCPEAQGNQERLIRVTQSESSKPIPKPQEGLTHAEADEVRNIKFLLGQEIGAYGSAWNRSESHKHLDNIDGLITRLISAVRAESEKENAELKAEIEKLKKVKI